MKLENFPTRWHLETFAVSSSAVTASVGFVLFFPNDWPAFAAPYVIIFYSPLCINPSAEKEDREEMRSVYVSVCVEPFLITIIATIQLGWEQLRAVMKRALVWRQRSDEQLVLVSSSSAGWRLICRLVGR